MQIQCMGLLKQLQDTVQICTLYIKVLQIFERFRSLWCFALLAAYFWVYVWGMTCMHATTQARFGMKMLLPHRGKFEYLLQQTIEVQNSRMNYFVVRPNGEWKTKKIQTVEFCWLGITWNHVESLGIWLIFRHWRRHIRRRNPWWGEWFSASSHPQNRSESVAWEKKHWMGRMGSMFMYFVVCSKVHVVPCCQMLIEMSLCPTQIPARIFIFEGCTPYWDGTPLKSSVYTSDPQVLSPVQTKRH